MVRKRVLLPAPKSDEIEPDRVSMPTFLGLGPTSTGGSSGNDGLFEIAEERGRVMEFDRDMAEEDIEVRRRRPKSGEAGGEAVGEAVMGEGAVSGGGQNKTEILWKWGDEMLVRRVLR